MRNLPEDSSIFDAGIYQIETNDPVIGGVDGISNKQAKALANRTAYLKAQLAAIDVAGGIAAHEALTDPHTQYATDAEVNALIDAAAIDGGNY
ncbi:MAG: hypothetical protein JKY87_00310 [Mariprofundus sp.]|nr:hypothetical protein [Mariprofundus sp.]